MSKTTILHVHHVFFVHFFAVPAQLGHELTKFQVYLETKTARR